MVLRTPKGHTPVIPPNFNVDVKGKTKDTVVAPNVTMGDDPHSVFTGGGTALVIHAKADDRKPILPEIRAIGSPAE